MSAHHRTRPTPPHTALLAGIAIALLTTSAGCATPGEQERLAAVGQLRNQDLQGAEASLAKCTSTVTEPASLSFCHHMQGKVRLLREDWAGAATSFSMSAQTRDAPDDGQKIASARFLFYWGWALLRGDGGDAQTRPVLEDGLLAGQAQIQRSRDGYLVTASIHLALAELHRRHQREAQALDHERAASTLACQERELIYLTQRDVDIISMLYLPTPMLVRLAEACAQAPEGPRVSPLIRDKALQQARARNETDWIEAIEAHTTPTAPTADEPPTPAAPPADEHPKPAAPPTP